jgi:alpha-glucosidase
MLGFYRALLAFRKQHPALIKGSIALLTSSEDILAFIREDGGEKLLCVFNMGENPGEFSIPSGMSPKSVDAPGVASEVSGGSLSLAPFAAYIGALH